MHHTPSAEPASPAVLSAAYRITRAASEALCAPLELEDLVVQSMPDASPLRWHLAHTTWFFETFCLVPFAPGYRPPHPDFGYLFNSYYEGVGPQFPRDRRGCRSRPTVAVIRAWRASVDAALIPLLADPPPELARRITLGIQHEQQHQELMLTDLKHALCADGDPPALWPLPPVPPPPLGGWLELEGGLCELGCDPAAAQAGHAFDNETPRHRAWSGPFALARELVTAAEYLRFIEAGGYTRPELWMSDGWATCQRAGWRAPLYWEQRDGAWIEHTLGGSRPLALTAPVAHLSWFEADAYARFVGARLPTEAEWERAAAHTGAQPGTPSPRHHPAAAPEPEAPLRHLFGQLWQWTGSAYRPYPGFAPLPGALGEYNGKFMHGQLVLRGSACATPAGHARHSYRNFFQAEKRWQFSGLRLARDL